MPKVTSADVLLSIAAFRRFSWPANFGNILFGRAYYGSEPEALIYDQFGNLVFGVGRFGDLIQLSGIYQKRHIGGKTCIVREKFYCPKNPRFELQQANRQIWADAVAAWHGLTQEQQAVYNERVKRKSYTGFNLFVKEYMLSH